MDIGAYLILLPFVEVPRLIGAMVSFFVARWAGNYAFGKSTNANKSMLLAIAVFLVVDFALSFVLRSEMSLMSAAASGAIYYYFVVWVPKIIALALLYPGLRRRFNVVETGAGTSLPNSITTLTYALVLGAVIAITLPIYSIFHTSTVIEQGTAHL